MKIAKTTAHTLRVPYQFPLIKETQYALTTFVEIETDDGLKGNAFSVYPQRYSVADLINREVAPVIAGMDPTRPEQVRNTLFWKIANKHFMGIWSMAASMVDVALWDIRGKALKQPIWKLMGGAREKCPIYITWGLPVYSREELVEYCVRRCRGWMIAGGSIEILKNRIAEGVFGRSFSQR